jgi:hypothetical protein
MAYSMKLMRMMIMVMKLQHTDSENNFYQTFQNTSPPIRLSNNQQTQNLILHVLLHGYESWSLILKLRFHGVWIRKRARLSYLLS